MKRKILFTDKLIINDCLTIEITFISNDDFLLEKKKKKKKKSEKKKVNLCLI